MLLMIINIQKRFDSWAHGWIATHMNLLFIMIMTEATLIFKSDVGWLMRGSTSAKLLFCPGRMIALPPGKRSPFDSQYLSSKPQAIQIMVCPSTTPCFICTY